MSTARSECIESTGAQTRPLKINIGGEKLIAVAPDLFDILGENKLSSMLSGRWQTLRDADGSILVDYSPDVFLPLVEWLRDMRDVEPDVHISVQVRPDRRYAWIRMMRSFAVDVLHLAIAGITFQELLNVGYSCSQLSSVYDPPAAVCLSTGMSAAELLQAGISESHLREAENRLASFNARHSITKPPRPQLHECEQVPLLECYRKRRWPK
ncbi:Shkbp1 [Symbiodinium sp. CCMP2592]|nr:Shkbp1 [Symbiodinium sp. CCMP2592]